MELTAPVAALAGAVLSSLGTLALLRRQGRKLTAEGRGADASAAEKYQKLAAEQFTEIQGLREQVETYQSDSDETAHALQDKARALAAENKLLRSAAPSLVKDFLLAAGDSKDVEWLLSFAGQPGTHLWCISSNVENGLRTAAKVSIIWLSEAWDRHLGYSREKLYGSGWYDHVHPDDQAKTARVAIGTNISRVQIGNRYRKADGSYLPLYWQALGFNAEGLTLSVALVVENGS